jgi:hypothetical protein
MMESAAALQLLVRFCDKRGLSLKPAAESHPLRPSVPSQIVWIYSDSPGEILGQFVRALADGHCPVIVPDAKRLDPESQNKM